MTGLSPKKCIIFGITFSTIAIVFAILYYFNVISTMSLLLTVAYVEYFVSLALFYNGAYNREKAHTSATVLNFLLGTLFVLLAIATLVYGFYTGSIALF